MAFRSGAWPSHRSDRSLLSILDYDNPFIAHEAANRRFGGRRRASDTAESVLRTCGSSSRFRIREFCSDLTVAVLYLNLYRLAGLDSLRNLLADQHSELNFVT